MQASFSPSIHDQGSELSLRAKRDHVIGFYLDSEDSITGFLGNFHIHIDQNDKEYKMKAADGKLYRCAEAAFQAMKFPQEYHNQFVDLDGEGAFSLKQKISVKIDIAKWNIDRYEVMLNILRSKFNKHHNPELAWLLDQTQNAHLVEHNMKKEDETTWSDAIYGEGYNVLGKMLEQVRQENRTGLLKIHYNDGKGHPVIPKAKDDPNIQMLYKVKPYNWACELKGCMRPKYRDVFGNTYEACGKTHGEALKKGVQKVSQVKTCHLPNCNKAVYDPNDPKAIACSRSHHKLVVCMNKDCSKPKYFDTVTNNLLDFCGRTCAIQAGAKK